MGRSNWSPRAPPISAPGYLDLGRGTVHLARSTASDQGAQWSSCWRSTTSNWSARGMRILGAVYHGTRHVTTSTKAVKHAGRQKGLKLPSAGE